ncbi:Ribose import ATP-binding protein RbsA [Baekduia alba]|uniref:sugar ABC transporter ATP-binding protein n=1 Tax=Baekduia alba TaxID=2997333 RepID=UPI0023405CDE|nr:sugar ABC transporter ATP-binding protein [Baekduia alba]WCB91769.1 Ribose import ATP-binding protein RbsA [Baekduia alba]
MSPLDEIRNDAAGEPGARLLQVERLSKSFPGVKALDDVALHVTAGEIVAVVGQNGSGKSTLVKVLAGIYDADPGARIEHRELRFIHQDLGLVPGLSTIENLDIGNPLGSRGLLPFPRRDERARAQRAIRRFGGDFDVTKPVADLAAAERAVVAIARAMSDWSPPDGVLLLDEPTAALGGEEVDKLFEAVRRVASEGAGVVFISHRLDEVLGLSDRLVALRDGRVVAAVPSSEVDHDGLVRIIAGREVAAVKIKHHRTDAVALRAEGLVTETLSGLDFEIRAGEILGITGLLGSGREEVAATVFGATARSAGAVTVGGEPVPAGDIALSVRRGLAYVPADRLRQGAVMTVSARENLTLPMLGPLRRAFGRLDRAAERREAREWVDRVGLHPPVAERALGLFSGGNQQKFVMAKWLRTGPRTLLLDEPTQGVDVGAKAAIYGLIDEVAESGAGVLVSSSDVKELMTLCDRVLVLRDGRVAAELDRWQLTEARLVSESLGLLEDPSLQPNGGEPRAGTALGG